MPDMKKSIVQIATLEDLTRKNTPVHRIQPSIKLITTIIYIITIISYSPYQVTSLLPYTFYPILLMTFGEIPLKPLLNRVLMVLPFTLFTGVTNMIYSRELAFSILNVGITVGMVSFCSILIKTILTVLAVLILVSTTSMNDIIYGMVSLKLPRIFVIQLMLTYRYIRVLLEEVIIMYHAYILRAPKEKGIKLKDMGLFLGQLIIRSFDRADRIYNAMKCKGFEGSISFSRKEKITKNNWIYMIVVVILLLFLRFVNVSEVVGNLFV